MALNEAATALWPDLARVQPRRLPAFSSPVVSRAWRSSQREFENRMSSMSDDHSPHIPVMLPEVLHALAIEPGQTIIDATFGAGGYTRGILTAGADVLAIDRDPDAIAAGQTMVDAFGGRLVLEQGRFSALDAIGPEDLRIPQLVERVEAEQISEVVLALNATIDGQTTAHYIADHLDGRTRLTSLAQGVPIGGELDYLDDGTITAALKARKEL